MKAAPSAGRPRIFGLRSRGHGRRFSRCHCERPALLCHIQVGRLCAHPERPGRDGVPASATPSADADRDFLTEFKLDREKTEKQQIDMLKSVIDDKEAGKEVRDAARAQYLMIVDIMGKELKIEGLLAARGFESVVFLSQDACTVVVRAPALDEKAVAQVGDTVRRITKLSLEKVTVIPAP